MFLPHTGGLAELVAELSAFLILGLPTHQSRPSAQKRLVNDFHTMPASFFFLANLERGQKPCIDELSQDVVGWLSILKDGKKLLFVPGGTGPLRGDQVVEKLSHDRESIAANAIHGCLSLSYYVQVSYMFLG